MKKFKKILVRTCLAMLLFIPVAAIAHYLIFPQETRSLLINYSGFKKDGRIYFNKATSTAKIDSLKSLIGKASARVSNFWGEKISDPKFIYCSTTADFEKYSANPGAPAITYIKLGAVIVLRNDAADLDIIAHEISHAKLYGQTGFYAFNYKIPSWFKQGLAMQNDYRDYYSEDTLRVRLNKLKTIPGIRNLKTDAQFYAGTPEEIMLHYMMAKHEVKSWYSKEKLGRFIAAINAGKTFDEAVGE